MFDVCDNVAGILDTDGEADQVGSYACFDQLFVRQLAVRMAGRVEDTGAGVGHMRNDTNHLQVVHKADGIFAGTFQAESDDTARAVRHIFLSQFIILITLQAGEVDPSHLLVRF